MFVGKRMTFEEEISFNPQYDLKRSISKAKQPVSLFETIKSQQKDKAASLYRMFPNVSEKEIHRMVETLEGNISLAKDILLNQQEESERQQAKKQEGSQSMTPSEIQAHQLILKLENVRDKDEAFEITRNAFKIFIAGQEDKVLSLMDQLQRENILLRKGFIKGEQKLQQLQQTINSETAKNQGLSQMYAEELEKQKDLQKFLQIKFAQAMNQNQDPQVNYDVY